MRRHRIREAEAGDGLADLLQGHAAVVEPDQRRAPGDQHAGGDGDEARRDALRVAHAAEPGDQDDGKARNADDRRHVHFQRRPHRDEGDGDAGQRAEQGGTRRDAADVGGDEAADHQDEALEEHPDEPRLPALDGIAGLQRDRQHDDEGDDEHVRHAHPRWQGAHVRAARAPGEAVGEEGVVHGREAHHQAERRQDAAEHEAVRHLQHEAQEAGQHQHVDQDVRAEAEEGVPVARGPKRGAAWCGGGGRHRSSPKCWRAFERKSDLQGQDLCHARNGRGARGSTHDRGAARDLLRAAAETLPSP